MELLPGRDSEGTGYCFAHGVGGFHEIQAAFEQCSAVALTGVKVTEKSGRVGKDGPHWMRVL